MPLELDPPLLEPPLLEPGVVVDELSEPEDDEPLELLESSPPLLEVPSFEGSAAGAAGVVGTGFVSLFDR